MFDLRSDHIICSAPLFRAGFDKLSVVICVNLCPFACPVASANGTGAVKKNVRLLSKKLQGVSRKNIFNRSIIVFSLFGPKASAGSVCSGRGVRERPGPALDEKAGGLM